MALLILTYLVEGSSDDDGFGVSVRPGQCTVVSQQNWKRLKYQPFKINLVHIHVRHCGKDELRNEKNVKNGE